MRKYNLFMEKFWLVAAIIGFVYAVYKIGELGLLEAGIYLLMPLVAASLSYLRYYTRKRYDNEQDDDSQST